jgi:lipopolysaccharide export system protein LptA
MNFLRSVRSALCAFRPTAVIRWLLLALAAVAFAHTALAANPVEVSADQFVVDQANAQATFTGNVVVSRADLKVWADKVVVHYGEGGVTNITNLIATGRVRLQTKDQTATGERATFDPRSQVLRLSGNVTVTSASGTLSGPELVINLVEQTSVFSSNGGGRVTGVFTPQ